jgi:hypothetical protein
MIQPGYAVRRHFPGFFYSLVTLGNARQVLVREVSMITKEQKILEYLGGGLVMRRSTPQDAERLGAFNGRIHGDDPADAEGVAAWTRGLLTLPHPTFGPDDFTIIEDTLSSEIVSSLNLISQTWMYEGIPFGVGRPELVGTDSAYRSRGLVRKQFDVVHEWSRQRGELAQVITGIPFFYRQFDYEMGLELGGGRGGYEPQVPQLEEGKEEPFIIRPAVEGDIPWIMRLHERETKRSMVAAYRDDALWRYELNGKYDKDINRYEFYLIQTQAGQPVGYLAHPSAAWGKMMTVVRYQLDEGVSYLAVNPAVIRYLWRVGQEYAQQCQRTLNAFGFWLGSEHPAYQATPGRFVFTRPSYAFYVRVPDLPAFLTHIAPALEQRLAASPCAGHTGELKISFYRSGVRLVFENGHLLSVEAWKPKIKEDEGKAAFPNLTFLQLVFGYRSMDEIRQAYADCSGDDEAKALLSALFPKKPSSVWPVS